jgi:AcrR family transcriptional regulator
MNWFMATPKKVNKIRDSEATKKKLVDSVAEIVRSEGFHLLGVNKIARLAEKDKGVIRYHFGGLNNLLRTYIKQKDYWPPFFERYKIDGSADQGEIKDMFTALMQENLKQFYADKEMQKIILWQITEGNPVLRQISEEREDEGQKLFDLTNPTFLKSGVSIKSVMALLLGGSYFAVLQAHSIKTRVCGVDVNWEKDLETLGKTIGQIISWAWERANEETKAMDMPINLELEKLEELAEKITGLKDTEKGSLNEQLSLVEAIRILRIQMPWLFFLSSRQFGVQLQTIYQSILLFPNCLGP